MSRKYSDPAQAGAGAQGRIYARLIAAALVAASLASACLALSCARKAAPSARTQPSPAPAAAPILPAAAPGANAAKPPPQIAPPAPLAASMRGFGLRAVSEPRIAWDFSIGPLQSSRPAAGDEAAVFTTASSFMKGLEEGKLDKSLLLPQSRDALAALLAPDQPGSSNPPAIPYRLGAIVLRGPDASLRLRLPAAAGDARVEGLLSLRKIDDTWYIEALALEPPTAEPLAFNPNASAGGRSR